MENYSITAVELKTMKETQLQIEADEAETSEEIILTTQLNGQTISKSDYAYFPAYQKLRDALLQAGYGLKCAGSQINAVQSGMMGACEKIYLVKPGKQALKKDIISLWTYSDQSTFPTTEDQTQFFTKWCASLSQPPSLQ